MDGLLYEFHMNSELSQFVLNNIIHIYMCMYIQVDESLRAEDVEVYYDPAELFAGFFKGPPISDSADQHSEAPITCPFAQLDIK